MPRHNGYHGDGADVLFDKLATMIGMLLIVVIAIFTGVFMFVFGLFLVWNGFTAIRDRRETGGPGPGYGALYVVGGIYPLAIPGAFMTYDWSIALWKLLTDG